MVGNSEAKLTGRGYVAWFEIPFKSLRFPRADTQKWGVLFERDIKRNTEHAFYPRITSNATGFLGQGAEMEEMEGMEDISPGRNMQFIPYLGRGFRHLRDRDPTNPYFRKKLFRGKYFELRPGLDANIVLQNSFVWDSTINPDGLSGGLDDCVNQATYAVRDGALFTGSTTYSYPFDTGVR